MKNQNSSPVHRHECLPCAWVHDDGMESVGRRWGKREVGSVDFAFDADLSAGAPEFGGVEGDADVELAAAAFELARKDLAAILNLRT